VVVTGVVQGVGFRPYVWRRATRLGLAGWVANDSGGVVIDVRGPAAAVAAFLDGLAAAAPPLAAVQEVRVSDAPHADDHGGEGDGFMIVASAQGPGAGTLPPADVASCAACLAEVAAPTGRRNGYAFTNCTDCGPRYTIIEDLPYDRAATTMRSFAMCPRCAAEYADPADRRFHAQPIACPACGPRLWFTTREVAAGRTERPAGPPDDAAAIAAARALLRAGGIVAVKGLGGFHVCCDATSAATVARLRAGKQRPGKPCAVLVADVAAAREIGVFDAVEAEAVVARDRPIVLVRKTVAGSMSLAAGVAPGTDLVGIMLPCMPLQHMLCTGMPPLVMTSGNVAEEPIVTDNAAAVTRLGAIADGFLLHDRRIHVACDDSVVRCVAGRPVPMRLARGRAPLPIGLGGDGPNVLAVGGDLKAAPCVTRGDTAFMGQHVGDTGSLATLGALARTSGHLLGLLRIEPEAVVADLHPGSVASAWAARFAAARGIPLVRVQHHEAHLAALLADRAAAAADVIGVCCDGTGYGRDGTIQGGEFIIAGRDGMRRVAHLEAFPLPGGDAAIRHPWRVALALLHAAGVPWDERLAPVQAAGAAGRRVLARQLATGIGCVPTTSMGRLFDGVAALAGLRQSVTYEAEAALALEAAADPDGSDRGYAFAIGNGDPLRVEWAGVVAGVAADARAGVPAAVIAGRFHRGVAAMIADVCGRLQGRGAGRVVGLTGGVFQNAALAGLTADALRAIGRDVLMHDRVPCNDGGLALGQAVLGRAAVAGGDVPAAALSGLVKR
jgi:hydrogenase maturation protein HypF